MIDRLAENAAGEQMKSKSIKVCNVVDRKGHVRFTA